MTRVLIIGCGDMGERFAAGLAASGAVRELVLADASTDLAARAATIASAHAVRVRQTTIDARNQGSVERLLRTHQPDLVVQAAALQSPWVLYGRTDAVARAVNAAGLGLRLPFQLPVLLSVMRAVRAVGHEVPVANLSFPDIANPILATQGLAPTVGLGNVSMLLCRGRAALLEERPDEPLPLARMVGAHHHVYGVMASTPPTDPADRPWLFLGEDGGERRDDLPYAAPAIAPGIRYNAVTAAAALPVLLALLPGAAPLRWSTPAPLGLPGGYPVRVENGAVSLDLPAGVSLADAVAFNERIARGDGVESIAPDGTVRFTENVWERVAPYAADVVEPLALDALDTRAARLLDLLRAP